MKSIARLAAVSVAASFVAIASAQITPMPPHNNTFTGNTRGYWFTAPVDFLMIGVRVLQDPATQNGFMNFAVVRFDGAVPPPAFPTVTNSFTQLALGLDQNAFAMSPVNVVVNMGDVIGVYGNTVPTPSATTGANSYSPPGVQAQTTIFGNNVDLFRSGMQFHLGTPTSPGGMHDIWSEASQQISRVEFEYTAVPEPTTIAMFGIGGALVFLLRRKKS